MSMTADSGAGAICRERAAGDDINPRARTVMRAVVLCRSACLGLFIAVLLAVSTGSGSRQRRREVSGRDQLQGVSAFQPVGADVVDGLQPGRDRQAALKNS